MFCFFLLLFAQIKAMPYNQQIFMETAVKQEAVLVSTSFWDKPSGA